MLIRLGVGKVKKIGRDLEYNGTFPICEDGDELVIVRANDLTDLLKNDVELLLTTQEEMPHELFCVEGGNSPYFESELIYTATDRTEHKLFLDRYFYSYNYKDMIFVRYVSVDQSFIEEVAG